MYSSLYVLLCAQGIVYTCTMYNVGQWYCRMERVVYSFMCLHVHVYTCTCTMYMIVHVYSTLANEVKFYRKIIQPPRYMYMYVPQ